MKPMSRRACTRSAGVARANSRESTCKLPSCTVRSVPRSVISVEVVFKEHLLFRFALAVEVVQAANADDSLGLVALQGTSFSRQQIDRGGEFVGGGFHD